MSPVLWSSQKQHRHAPPEPVIGLIHPGKIAQIVRCEAKNQQNPGKRLNAKRAFSHEDAFFFYPGFSLYAGTMGTSWKPSFAAFFVTYLTCCSSYFFSYSVTSI